MVRSELGVDTDSKTGNMTLLRVDERCPFGRKRLIATLRCDVCGDEFERSLTKVKKQTFHICSKSCMTTSLRVGGVLAAKRIASVMSHYGVEHVSQVEDIKEKKRLTSLMHYGCESPLQSDVVKAKMRQSCVERYGVEYPMQDPDIMEKRKQTSCDKYGTAFPFERSAIRSKAIATNLERYGVSVPIQSPIVRARTDWSQQKLKEYETMKRNGTYGKSKPEDRLYEVLCEMFGVNDVERQSLVYKWPIDFYVKSVDTYIQYDSYWHGVGRDINEVAEYKNKRDVVIHKKMLTDAAQVRYFAEHDMKLVRVQGLKCQQITQDAIKLILEASSGV